MKKNPLSDRSQKLNHWNVAQLKLTYPNRKTDSIQITDSMTAYHAFLDTWNPALINIQEQFCALFLSSQKEVIGFRVISTGKLSSTTVDFHLLFSCALLCRADSIMVAHNHPSGSLSPSRSDTIITDKLKKFGELLEFNIIDHLIITKDGYYSFEDSSSFLLKESRVISKDQKIKQLCSQVNNLQSDLCNYLRRYNDVLEENAKLRKELLNK